MSWKIRKTWTVASWTRIRMGLLHDKRLWTWNQSRKRAWAKVAAVIEPINERKVFCMQKEVLRSYLHNQQVVCSNHIISWIKSGGPKRNTPKKKNELTQSIDDVAAPAEAASAPEAEATANNDMSAISIAELKDVARRIIAGESSELPVTVKGEMGELLRLLSGINKAKSGSIITVILKLN